MKIRAARMLHRETALRQNPMKHQKK